MFLVYCAALGIRLVWAALVPPWAAPDEMQHFTYVTYIVEQGAIPSGGPYAKKYPVNQVEESVSCAHTFCTRISGLWHGKPPEWDHFPVQHDYAPAREYQGAKQARLSEAGGAATGYPPLYYLFCSLFYGAFYSSPVLTRLMAVRAATAIVSSLACCFGYLLGYEISRKRSWGLALGLGMALAPMHAFIGACVNNDAALFASSTALCWLSVRVIRAEAVSLRHTLALGLASALVLLSKPTGLPIVMFAFAALLWKSPPFAFMPLRRIAAGIRNLGAFAATLVLAEGAWFLVRRMNSASGTSDSSAEADALAAIASGAKYSFGSYLASRYAEGAPYFRWLFLKSGWGLFGWQEIPLSERVYDAILAVLVMGFAGLVLRVIGERNARGLASALAVVVLLQLSFLFVVADYLMAYRHSGRSFGLQGRYFLPVLAPFLFLVLSGWSRLFRDRGFAVWIVPCGILGLQVVSLHRLLTGYYSLRFG